MEHPKEGNEEDEAHQKTSLPVSNQKDKVGCTGGLAADQNRVTERTAEICKRGGACLRQGGTATVKEWFSKGEGCPGGKKPPGG